MKWLKKFKAARKLRHHDIEATLRRIRKEREYAQPGTEEFKRLQEDYERELKNRKLVKEMRYLGWSPDKIILVVGMLLVAGLGVMLDLDSPKALKIAQFALNLVKKA